MRRLQRFTSQSETVFTVNRSIRNAVIENNEGSSSLPAIIRAFWVSGVAWFGGSWVCVKDYGNVWIVMIMETNEFADRLALSFEFESKWGAWFHHLFIVSHLHALSLSLFPCLSQLPISTRYRPH